MAKLIGGLGSSHIPLIGHKIDADAMDGDYWAAFKEGIKPARAWIEKNKPDVMIVIYNDHGSNFNMTLKNVIPFGIGIGKKYLPADEGYGRRKIPTFDGHPKLSAHIAESLIFDEFDIALSHELDVDHGCTVPMSILYGKPEVWPMKIIPLYVGVIQYPQPTGNRCFNLGKAIRKAVESYPEDIKVAIIGTGGLSHQIQGPRAGLLNVDYDKKWLDSLIEDPKSIKDISAAELIRETGSEGAESIMWLVMRGAMSEKVKVAHRFSHAPVSNTHYNLLILENEEQK